MTSPKKMRNAGTFLRVTIGVAALGYLAWHEWHRRNNNRADIWAQGTDQLR